MTPSVPGTVLLAVLGLGFAVAGIRAARRAGRRGHGRLSATFDLFIAATALTDAGMALVVGPVRVLMWGLASACLVGAALVAVRRSTLRG